MKIVPLVIQYSVLAPKRATTYCIGRISVLEIVVQEGKKAPSNYPPHWTHPAFPCYPVIPLTEALHLLVELCFAQKLFHFRCVWRGAGRSKALSQPPHQHRSEGGIVFGFLRINRIINICFSVIIGKVRSPFLLRDQVGDSGDEEIEVVRPIDGLKGIGGAPKPGTVARIWSTGREVPHAHSDRSRWCARSLCQT